MRKPLVMGNWKLNGSKSMIQDLLTNLTKELKDVKACDVSVAPPTIYLDYVQKSTCCANLILAAQNVDIHLSGAHTGDVSASMLKEIGVTHVIIGHSERRTDHKESDELIAQKFAVLKENGLIPVLCIGETDEENEVGKTQAVCAKQIDAVINQLGIKAFNHAVIAYEPIWAIGTGKSATPAQAQSVHKFIRDHLAQFDSNVANQVIIQYGGSVNDKNAAELFSQPDIDGALVGGASLKASTFMEIVKAAEIAKNR